MLKNHLTAIVARITVISASVVLVSFLFAANVLADMQMNNQLEYGKSIHTYRTPNVNLIDGREREIDFAAAVEQEEMVIISFAFT
ncbi:MAG TPA: hypothetical protein PKM20_11190, partial [Nitrosomonas sp.]|nr:hypothetical protein [Nitrosomonas sp.]